MVLHVPKLCLSLAMKLSESLSPPQDVNACMRARAHIHARTHTDTHTHTHTHTHRHTHTFMEH